MGVKSLPSMKEGIAEFVMITTVKKLLCPMFSDI